MILGPLTPKLPSSSNIEATLPCAATVDNVSAIKACEAAAMKCGFLVAARTRRSLLLMPMPRRALMKCFSPGAGRGRDVQAGCGISAELVPSADGGGLAVSVTTPSALARREAFMCALSDQLTLLSSSGGSSPSSSRSPQKLGREASGSRFKNELSAYYYFSKLLLSEAEAPGMASAQFVQRFHDTYKGLSPTAVEQGRPMRECMGAVDQLSRLVEELLANLDAEALANLAELRPWLRSSVERCVFARVGQVLWHLYDGRHSAEDAQYTQKARALRRVSDTRLLDVLGVSSQFRGSVGALRPTPVSEVGDPSSPDGAPSEAVDACFLDEPEDSCVLTPVTRSTAAETEEANLSQAPPAVSLDQLSEANASPLLTLGYPYERAAAALSQIEVGLLSNTGRNCTPREIVEALTFSQFEMKTCALEVSSGQMELCAMDDILPVFVFVLLRSSLTKPFACARFMNDSLSKDESLESEGRAVLLLESAARHVAFDWDISQILPDRAIS